MKKLLLILGLLLAPTAASAQCTGVFQPNTLCGNLTGTAQPPSQFSASGTVSGPVSSIPGDVAEWNNSSGTLLKDVAPSAVIDQLCSTNNDFLIRLSGTWQCGTAGTGLASSAGALNLQPSAASTIGGVQSKTCAGSNWISTISTAGVETCTQPAFTDISGTASAAQLPATGGLGFYFDKNSTNQTGITTGAYALVTFSTSKFNTTGAALTSSTWTAPISGLVMMEGTVFWNAHAASSGNPNFTLKFVKNSAGVCNGSDVFAGIGTPIVGFATAAINFAIGIDQATAGDVYELCAFGTSDDAGNDLGIDGNAAHTHWSGAYIR